MADTNENLIPMRYVSKGDYLSVGGEWRCTKVGSADWLLIHVASGTRIPGFRNLIAAQRYIASQAPGSTPVAPTDSTPADADATSAAAATVEFKAAVVAPPVPTESETREAIKQLADDLNRKFKERREIIEQTLAAILTGENVLMLGPPGTAKSALVRAVARSFGATYFERLLTKQSKPDELHGPPSLAALKEGRYEREINGFLPTVHFGFVDEVFKANGAILNSLLALMNERIFHNGNTVISCPLISLFGASNEGPESKELDAVYDRFLVRLQFTYVDRDDNFMAMVMDPEPTSGVSLSLETLTAAQAEVAAVKLNVETVRAMRDVQNALKAEQIIVSDRRFKKIAKLLRAFAWMDGAAETEPEHLMKCVDAMWAEPKHRVKIIKVVGQFADVTRSKAAEIMAAAEEAYKAGDNGGAPSKTKALHELRDAYTKMAELGAKCSASKRPAIEAGLRALKVMGERMKAQASKVL